MPLLSQTIQTSYLCVRFCFNGWDEWSVASLSNPLPASLHVSISVNPFSDMWNGYCESCPTGMFKKVAWANVSVSIHHTDLTHTRDAAKVDQGSQVHIWEADAHLKWRFWSSTIHLCSNHLVNRKTAFLPSLAHSLMRKAMNKWADTWKTNTYIKISEDWTMSSKSIKKNKTEIVMGS